MRATAFVRRTSRRGPGGWSNPTLASFGRGALESRGAHRSGPQDYRNGAAAGLTGAHRRPAPSGSTAPYSFLSSASFYDSGDNGPQQAVEADGTAVRNYRADRRLTEAPSFMRNGGGLRGQPFSAASGDAGPSEPSDVQSVRRVERDPGAVRERVVQSSNGSASTPGSGAAAGGEEPRAKESTWLGGRSQGTLNSDPLMSRHRGINNFSMIDRDEVTVTSFLRMLMDATFQPRDADSTVFGGDNRSKMAEQKEELKSMDPHLVPYAHDDLMNNYLKNITQLHSPSGQVVSRDMLKGRLVGLLFFSESDRCFRFMRELKVFHRRNSPDFVVVALSAGGKEMVDVTRGFGFFHCTHRDGATWVKRDAGLMIRPFLPLPRLVIVDGTTGFEVSRSGVTAVVARPDTCMEAWKRNESGVEQWDWLRAVTM